MRAIELEVLVIHECLQSFELASSAARNVQGVRNVDRCVVEVEDTRAKLRHARRSAANLLAGRGCIGIDTRPQSRARFRGEILARLLERGLRRGQVGTLGKRVADQFVEGLGTKERPPLRRQISARDQALLLPGRTRRCGGRPGDWRFRVALGSRGLGALKIRPDHASRQRKADCKRNNHAPDADHVVLLL